MMERIRNWLLGERIEPVNHEEHEQEIAETRALIQQSARLSLSADAQLSRYQARVHAEYQKRAEVEAAALKTREPQ